MYVSPAGIKQKIERAIACPARSLIEIWAALMLDDEPCVIFTGAHYTLVYCLI